MAAPNPPAPVIVKPATKIPTPKFTDHEANGEGTKLLQEEANACFALCGAHELVEPLLDLCGDAAGQTALLDAHKLVANKACATQQIALCGEVDQQAGVHMLEKLAAQLKPTVTRLVKNGTAASEVGILKFLHERCPPDTFDANSAKAALLTEEGMVHIEPQVPGQGSMHDQIVTWALCMKEDHASALENVTAKSHMPGIATALKPIMNRASEVKGTSEDKTCVQKMNEQAQLQNCTVEQLLDHVVQGDKSRLHDVHSNNAAFSTTGSHDLKAAMKATMAAGFDTLQHALSESPPNSGDESVCLSVSQNVLSNFRKLILRPAAKTCKNAPCKMIGAANTTCRGTRSKKKGSDCVKNKAKKKKSKSQPKGQTGTS